LQKGKDQGRPFDLSFLQLDYILKSSNITRVPCFRRDLPGLGNNVQTAISWSAVGMAFAVATATGLFFGIYPASRASKLKPIDALHYE